MKTFHTTYDVIVVGGGNAGFSAATTAVQSGARRVLLVEKAPETENGGNTFYTAGAYRYAFSGLDDLKPILYDVDTGARGLSEDLLRRIDLEAYSEDDFMRDLMRVTKGRSDKRLAEKLVKESRAAIQWISDNGGKFVLSFNRQAYEIKDRFVFWGGMVTMFRGGGKELVKWHITTAREHGVEIWWQTPALGLISDEASGKVLGIEVFKDGSRCRIEATGGVILACGGFSADPALRAKYLGPGWDLAHVRGSPFNTGDGHRMAKQLGAKTAGNYSGCHSTCWDAGSPRNGGDRVLTNQFTKSGYPLGLMLNCDGNRFVDEGLDLRNYTYAIFGIEVLKQPSGKAFQIWDAEGSKWLRKEEYADDVTTNIRADTLEALAEKLVQCGLTNKSKFVDTVNEYNDAVDAFTQENPNKQFNPAEKDGLSTQSSSRKLALAKSNWARPLKKAPFTAVEVTSGVTFTFGGLDVDPDTAQVISDASRQPIDGLYCCGELLGGLFFSNYPGGSGLTAGTVFGRIAGKHAAQKKASWTQQFQTSKL